VWKSEKKCEKFGKIAKNVREIAKNSIVLVNFVCFLRHFTEMKKVRKKSLILAGAGMRFAYDEVKKFWVGVVVIGKLVVWIRIFPLLFRSVWNNIIAQKRRKVKIKMATEKTPDYDPCLRHCRGRHSRAGRGIKSRISHRFHAEGSGFRKLSFGIPTLRDKE